MTAKQGIDLRFFVLGCAFLAAVLALVVWAFSKTELADHQRQLLRWALPLASGFLVGSFVGSLTVHSKGFAPGLAATATGGFGVWLLTFFVLFPTHPVEVVEAWDCQIGGRVQDAESHQPASDVVVTTADGSGTSGADGQFHFWDSRCKLPVRILAGAGIYGQQTVQIPVASRTKDILFSLRKIH